MTDAYEAMGAATRAVHGGFERSQFEEMSEPIYATQGYVYPNAAEAEAAFAGEITRYQYSRYANPTVTVFEERLRLLEGAEACIATASGMAAVFASMAPILTSGSRLVAARALFGSSIAVFDNFFASWGITVDYVDAHVPEDWEKALAKPADAIYIETPTNPMQDIVDLQHLAPLAKKAGALLIVDNVFATQLGQRPFDLGADAVVYSATKHIDGQGRVLGGAVLGSAEYIGKVTQFLRNTGASLSPFNAWVLAKSLETMAVRVKAQAASALRVASKLEGDDRIGQVRYPLLSSHPQYELATRQMTLGGTVVTFDLAMPNAARTPAAAKAATFRFMDALQVVKISNNLGDAKSIVTHPATTTHAKLTPDARAHLGIKDTTVRLSVGLEDTADILADLDQALTKV